MYCLTEIALTIAAYVSKCADHSVLIIVTSHIVYATKTGHALPNFSMVWSHPTMLRFNRAHEYPNTRFCLSILYTQRHICHISECQHISYVFKDLQLFCDSLEAETFAFDQGILTATPLHV